VVASDAMSPDLSAADRRSGRLRCLAALVPVTAARSARIALFGAVLLVGLVVAGCGVVATESPVPTPADFPGIVSELHKRGVTLSDWVSGDAGCTDRTLIPTAIGFDASGLDQATKVRAHIYIFRNRDAFDRLRGSVDDCARSYVTDPAAYENVAESPFVVAAQGPWGPKFEAALREALAVAAGTGG
jgi:hypothetical protein